MTGRRSLLALDRLIRVREIRARQALAAAGRVETRRQSEAALVARVERLIAREPTPTADLPALAASAQAAVDDMLGVHADRGRARLASTAAEQARLVLALGRAQAAVDAAVARRRDRETEA